MASIKLTSGIGASSGHAIVTADDLLHLDPDATTSQKVIYVGPGGVDAASPAGRFREQPLATFSQAYTNAQNGDVIVLLSSHVESIASAIVISKTDLTIVSEGTGASRARFTCSGAAISMFDVTGAGNHFYNLVFPASTGAGSIRIRCAAAGLLVEDCAFECGASDTQEAVSLITGWGNARITGTSFTAVASRPNLAVEVVNAGSRLTMKDVTFDGGSFGWGALAFTGTAVITGLKALNIHQLNGSDCSVVANSTGWWIKGTCTGGSLLIA